MTTTELIERPSAETPNFNSLIRIRRSVLDSVPSANSKRAYNKGLETFFAWQVEAGSPELSRTAVLAFRCFLESRQLSSSTIGVYLSAVRKLANEAADQGLLDLRIAVDISKVPGLKGQSVRLGNWLGAEETGALLRLPDCSTLKGCRDRAMLGLMVGCALGRTELARLAVHDFQTRDTRWILPAVRGRGGRMRAVPVPIWVKLSVDAWVAMAEITEGRVFRSVNKRGVLWGEGISEDTVWALTREYGARMGRPKLSPHDLRHTCARLCKTSGGSLEQIQLLLGHASVQTTARYLGICQDLSQAINDDLHIPLNDGAVEVSRKGPQSVRADRVTIAVPDEPGVTFRRDVRGSR